MNFFLYEWTLSSLFPCYGGMFGLLEVALLILLYLIFNWLKVGYSELSIACPAERDMEYKSSSFVSMQDLLEFYMNFRLLYIS